MAVFAHIRACCIEERAGSYISWKQIQHQWVEVTGWQTVAKRKEVFPAVETVWKLNELQGVGR